MDQSLNLNKILSSLADTTRRDILRRVRRQGKQQYVSLSPPAFANAAEYLEWYRRLWEERYDSLEAYLNKEQQDGRSNQD
ncbi:MAG: hypothetical protein K0S68_993 [Candidatus Saccharibacteria bacterium]|nr:hypothetical protein [Candidatus Saccharibacteria bacterium]